MRLKVSTVSDGPLPDEIVVAVPARGGERTFVLRRCAVLSGSVDIGFPLGRDDDDVLVEVPSVPSGPRMWVHSSLVVGDADDGRG